MQNATENDLLVWSEFFSRIINEEPSWVRVVYGVVISIVFVTGIVGNLLTCIVIYSDRSMHTATNYYLFNLAVSDIIVNLVFLLEIKDPLLMDDKDFYNRYDDFVCKMHFLLIMTLWNHGILVMTALAVERYIAICYPLVLKSSSVIKRVSKIIGVIWIIALAESVPEVLAVGLMHTKNSYVCFVVPTTRARIVNGVLAFFTFLLPLVIMVFMYTMIAFKMNKSQQASNSRDKVFNHRDNRSKVNKLIALTLSFLVCWVPYFTVRLLIFALDVKQIVKLNNWWNILYKLSALNCMFSAVLNPLLFSLMSTKFRTALKTLWTRITKRDVRV